MASEQRIVSPSFFHLLLVSLILLGALTALFAGSTLVDRIDEPSPQAMLDVSETDLGVEVTVAASQSRTDVLVTRNGWFVGRFEASAGVTRHYYGSRGDTFRFVTLDETGARDAVLRSYTVHSRTAFVEHLSLDERLFVNHTVRVDGAVRPVTLTGIVRPVAGHSGTAVAVLYRARRTPSGVRVADVPEYDSYSLTFLVRSDGDGDDDNGAADASYARTHLLGWADGHALVAYGRRHADRIAIGTGRGDPFATVGTDTDDWRLVTVSREAGSDPVACVSGPAAEPTCRRVEFDAAQRDRSDFVVADSAFSGEVDDLLLFRTALSATQRRHLHETYFGNRTAPSASRARPHRTGPG